MQFQFIFLPLIAALLAQIIKMVINGLKGQFTWKDLNSYGGMPSSHAALVICLFSLVGYREGWASASTAIALIFAIIIIRDAAGFRRALGRHATELNQIVHTLNSNESFKFKHLQERIGHTPLQLFFGSLLGVFITVLFVILF